MDFIAGLLVYNQLIGTANDIQNGASSFPHFSIFSPILLGWLSGLGYFDMNFIVPLYGRNGHGCIKIRILVTIIPDIATIQIVLINFIRYPLASADIQGDFTHSKASFINETSFKKIEKFQMFHCKNSTPLIVIPFVKNCKKHHTAFRRERLLIPWQMPTIRICRVSFSSSSSSILTQS